MRMRTQSGTPKSKERPFVFLNLAMTADGKIAPANRRFVPFSSKRDHELMYVLRARADAVMAGARTVDSALVTMGSGGHKYRAQRFENGLEKHHMRIVVSGSASIDAGAAIFRKAPSPLIILVSEAAKHSRITRLEKLGAHVHVCGGKDLDFAQALRWLRTQWNVQRLLCEGGGEINAALLRENLVDQIYVTLTPKIFGGRNAPTLADGLGIKSLNTATRFKLQSQKQVRDEMFLVYSAVKN